MRSMFIVVALLALASSVAAQNVAPAVAACDEFDGSSDGVWSIINHPDGAARNPTYCLRLDGFDSKTSNAVHLFDCSANAGTPKGLKLTKTGNTVVIDGFVYGGKKANSAVPNDEYYVSIEYTLERTRSNAKGPLLDFNEVPRTGSIIGPIVNGDINGAPRTQLDAKQSGGYSFYISVGDRCASHPSCTNKFVGEGWVQHHKELGWNYKAASDFLFVVGECIPEDPIDPVEEPCVCESVQATTGCLDDNQEHFETAGKCICVQWVSGTGCTVTPLPDAPCDN